MTAQTESNSAVEKSRVREEAQALYPIVTTDIRNAKSDQWSITNYAMLIYAALVGLSSTASSNERITVHLQEKIAFASLAFATLVAGIYFIEQQKRILQRSRERLRCIQERLHPETQSLLQPEGVEAKTRQTRTLSVFLEGALLLGFGCVMYVLFRIQ